MNWVDVALIAALCAASYSRNYWLMLLALVLCCLLREWGQWLIEAVFCVGAAGIALGLLIAWLAPASSVLMCLRFIRAEGWRGEKAIVASAPREAGKGYPLRPGRWLRVRVGEKDGEKEYPALMFALDDSPLAVGDEVEILHEIWEKYDEISIDPETEDDAEKAEKAGAKMIARHGLPCKIPPIVPPPAAGELEEKNLHRRPALILTYLEVAKKTETYYDLPPQHGLR